VDQARPPGGLLERGTHVRGVVDQGLVLHLRRHPGARRADPVEALGEIRQGREVGADGVHELHEIGCTAQIRRVEALPDGRYDLVTTGARRFRLLKAYDDVAPYLVGDIELLDEEPGDDADVLAGSVTRHYLAYRDQLLSLQGQAPRVRGPMPRDPVVLSYLVAAAMVLDRTDKQDLLEAPDTAARLRAELALLRRERVMLTHLPSLPGADIAREAGNPN
jgi:Lon protease-like protein